jgi:hypothetical protein
MMVSANDESGDFYYGTQQHDDGIDRVFASDSAAAAAATAGGNACINDCFTVDDWSSNNNFSAEVEDETSATASLTSPAPPSSVIILHSIASYLSLGDAMSMSVAAAASSSSASFGGFVGTPSPTKKWGRSGSSGGILRSAASAPMHPSNIIATTAAATTTTLAQCHSFDYHHHHGSLLQNNTLLLMSPEEMEEEMDEDEFIAEIIAHNNDSNNNYWGRMNGERNNHNIIQNHIVVDKDERMILGLEREEEDEEEEETEEDWFVGGGVRGLLSSPLPDDDNEEEQHPVPPPAQWTPAGQATGECENDELFEYNAAAGCNSGVVVTSCQEDMGEGDQYHHPSQPQESSSSYPTQKNCNQPHYHQPHPHDMALQKLQQRQRKQLLQNKLAAAVFSHPHPLRHYCLDAYATALGLSAERRRRRMMMMRSSPGGGGSGLPATADDENQYNAKTAIRDVDGPSTTTPTPTATTTTFNTFSVSPATFFAPPQHGPPLFHIILTAFIYDNIPLSVLLELLESTCDLSISTLWATGHITTSTIEYVFSSICNVASHIIDILSKFNPFHVLEFILNAQRRAMGKTGDVLVSGIQSVATGVGSVSNAALNRLSRSGLALAGGVVGSRSSSHHHVGEGGIGHHHNHNHRAGGVLVGDKILDSKVSDIILCSIFRISHSDPILIS